jgi:pre-mRNA-splicing factor SYF2
VLGSVGLAEDGVVRGLEHLLMGLDAASDAHKKYERNIRVTKPDLTAYDRQKEAALGLTPGTLVRAGGSGGSGTVASRSKGMSAAEDLYRGKDTLSYGDSKPTEDAVDRVIGKINKE